MLGNQQLMSQKEKDYIASCFNRTANSLKTDINYEDILNGQRIEYDLKDGKKELKIIFGKAFKRSRKQFRPSSNTDTTFLENNLMISQLYETLSILKVLNIDDETRQAIENSILVHLKNNFSLIIKNQKIYDFLTQFFMMCSESVKFDTISLFYLNSASIEDSEKLFIFLDQNLKMIPVNSTLILKDLWRSNSGCLLALFLLLKDQTLFDKILQAFLSSKVINCDYLKKFISVLISCSDNSQKLIIEDKLKKENITDFSSLLENLTIKK